MPSQIAFMAGVYVDEFSERLLGYFCFFQKTYPSFWELEALVIEFIWEWVMGLLYDMVAVQFNYISSPFLRSV